MKTILEFIKNQPDNIPKNLIDNNKLSESFNDLKNIINLHITKYNKLLRFKSNPKIKKSQIWLCKKEYYDALGNSIRGEIPYLVLLVSDEEKLSDKNFVRIQPITPFIEFKAEDEILIEDDNIVGFPFVIETWNEQPILTDLLEEFVNDLNVNILSINEKEILLTENQKEFRKTEIRNTAYLRQSINSFIEYEELNTEKAIILNIDNNIHFAEQAKKGDEIIDKVSEPETEYLLAAKKGKQKERKTFLFDETINEVNLEIIIIKEDDKYILSIKEPENSEIEFKDLKGNILKQASANLYDGLKSGLYFINIKGIDNEIRIILK